MKKAKQITRHFNAPVPLAADAVVLDTETTGTSSEDRVIELAMTKINQYGEETAQYHSYFRCEKAPTSIALKIHGLTTAFLRGKPNFADKVDEIAEFIGDLPIIAHNAQFDWTMLDAEFRRAGKNGLKNHCICTLKLSRARLDIPCKKRLEDLALHFCGKKRTTAIHGAKEDVELLIGILRPLNVVAARPAVASAGPIAASLGPVACNSDHAEAPRAAAEAPRAAAEAPRAVAVMQITEPAEGFATSPEAACGSAEADAAAENEYRPTLIPMEPFTKETLQTAFISTLEKMFTAFQSECKLLERESA